MRADDSEEFSAAENPSINKSARYKLALERRKSGRTAPESFSALAKIPG